MTDKMCRGHLIPVKKTYINNIPIYECHACVDNEENKKCELYREIGTYEVKDAKVRKGLQA